MKKLIVFFSGFLVLSLALVMFLSNNHDGSPLMVEEVKAQMETTDFYEHSLKFYPNRGQLNERLFAYKDNVAGSVAITNEGDLEYYYGDAVLIESFGAGVNVEQINLIEPDEFVTNLYLPGPDSEDLKNINSYQQLLIEDVYPSIDLRLKASPRNVEKQFEVAAGGDITNLVVSVEGDELQVNEDGELVASDNVRFSKPVAYQIIEGERKDVEVEYEILSSNTYTFEVGDYDSNYELVIDPVVESNFYSTDQGYLNNVYESHLGSNNLLYVVGETKNGAAFPVGSPEQSNPTFNFRNPMTLYIAVLDPTDLTLQNFTYYYLDMTGVTGQYIGNEYLEPISTYWSDMHDSVPELSSGNYFIQFTHAPNNGYPHANEVKVFFDENDNIYMAATFLFADGINYNTAIPNYSGTVDTTYFEGGTNVYGFLTSFDKDLNYTGFTSTVDYEPSQYRTRQIIDLYADSSNIYVLQDEHGGTNYLPNGNPDRNQHLVEVAVNDPVLGGVGSIGTDTLISDDAVNGRKLVQLLPNPNSSSSLIAVANNESGPANNVSFQGEIVTIDKSSKVITSQYLAPTRLLHRYARVDENGGKIYVFGQWLGATTPFTLPNGANSLSQWAETALNPGHYFGDFAYSLNLSTFAYENNITPTSGITPTVIYSAGPFGPFLDNDGGFVVADIKTDGSGNTYFGGWANTSDASMVHDDALDSAGVTQVTSLPYRQAGFLAKINADLTRFSPSELFEYGTFYHDESLPVSCPLDSIKNIHFFDDGLVNTSGGTDPEDIIITANYGCGMRVTKITKEMAGGTPVFDPVPGTCTGDVCASVDVECPTGTSGPTVTVSPSLAFENVTFGAGNLSTPIASGQSFVINVFDDRNYHADPTLECGPGFDVVMQADPTQFFTSGSGNNDAVLELGGADPNNLKLQPVSWTDSESNGGLIEIIAGDATQGVTETNISGMALGDQFVYDPDAGGPGVEGFNSITLLSVGESFGGEVSVTFEEDDITLGVPASTPVDTYTKEMTITYL